MVNEELIRKELAKLGIYTPVDLRKAIKELPPLDLGLIVGPDCQGSKYFKRVYPKKGGKR